MLDILGAKQGVLWEIRKKRMHSVTSIISYEQVVRIMIIKMLITMIIYDNDNNNYYYNNDDDEDSDDDDNHNNNLKLQSPLLDIIGSQYLPVSSHN